VEIAFVLTLVVLAIVVLANEWLAVEVFSILLMVLLAVTGVLTPRQAFQGFASSTVLMVAGISLLSGALVHNGAGDLIARRIQGLAGGSERRMAVLLLGAVNALSSFINNVAATAVFIPVAESVAGQFARSRKRYLMPVAFASMTGGMCTLIGTSTNVAVSGAMSDLGLRPLGMFELSPVGLSVGLVAGTYLLVVAPRLLEAPGRGTAIDEFRVREFLFELLVREEAPFAGRSLDEADLGRTLGIEVLAIVRGDERIDAPGGREEVLPGDLLLVKSDAERIASIRASRGLVVKSLPPAELESEGARLAEVTVSYNSPLLGKTLKEASFRRTYGLSVLAIHRREEPIADKVGKIPLRAGDVLLAYGPAHLFHGLGQEPTELLVERLVLPAPQFGRALRAGLVLGGAILVSALGWVEAPTAFLGGAGLAMALGYLSGKEAGGYLNVRFLVMLAAMASLGLAMEESGAAAFLAELVVRLTGGSSPWIAMGAFFGLTVLLTQPLSNAAAGLLVLPVAIHGAHGMGLDPRPFAVAVAIAASCSFLTPFEPACLLVYATGHYRFLDFLRVGGGLTLLAALVSLFLIPALWPLGP
jgi:di/tricarboxylate transporter